jgi:hypothetical protein
MSSKTPPHRAHIRDKALTSVIAVFAKLARCIVRARKVDRFAHFFRTVLLNPRQHDPLQRRPLVGQDHCPVFANRLARTIEHAVVFGFRLKEACAMLGCAVEFPDPAQVANVGFLLGHDLSPFDKRFVIVAALFSGFAQVFKVMFDAGIGSAPSTSLSCCVERHKSSVDPLCC